MNEDIQFRGRRRDTGEWVYGHYVFMGIYDDNPVHRIVWQDDDNVEHNVIVDPQTVGQSSTVYDKDRTEIFKGDLWRSGPIVYEVIFTAGMFAAKPVRRYGRGRIKGYSKPLAYMAAGGKVVGSIYDNPDYEPNKSGEFRECLCQICNREYVVWFAPNELWNKVMRRSDGSDIYPFVCMNCFAKKAEAQGVKPAAWRLSAEGILHSDKQKTLRFRQKQIAIKALNYLLETAPLSIRDQKDAEDSIKCLED